MQQGDIVADRFEVEALAGAGAMGQVYRARERASGHAVALKVLKAEARRAAVRFAREAQVLAELDHPAIVRHVAHGSLPSGDLYLAMEWLDGEDLAQRLRRGPLSIPEALTLARRLADALAVAHATKLVHRDIKPSNIFLPAGRAEHAKLLDFGIVHMLSGPWSLTRAGGLIGTPGYMSPEQARGERVVDRRSDVFSLGCVLYEALAGEPPFNDRCGAHDAEPGDDLVAVLARVLFSEPRPLQGRRSDVPEELNDLVHRMLAKNPDERPADGTALRAWLLSLNSTGAVPARSRELGLAELRRLFVVVARPERSKVRAEAATVTGVRPAGPPISLDPALMGMAADPETHVDQLLDGTAVVAITTQASATDAARRAASCALALATAMPKARIAVSTGTGHIQASQATGDAIDRAVAMTHSGRLGIRIDEGIASLLGSEFAVERDETGWTLFDRQARGRELPHTLLGRPSPCVGRDRELALLEGNLAACINDKQARAVLVTGPPGVGKTRLVNEFLGRVAERHGRIQIWIVGADELSSGSPFLLLTQLIRRTAGILGGEDIDAQRDKLLARLARHLPEDEARRLSEFFGEMTGIGAGDSGSALLAAARRDPNVMALQTCAAWEKFVGAEARVAPLVIVLEDVHWGDVPSLSHVRWALSRLTDESIFVVSVGRPEVATARREYWEGLRLEHIELAELPPRACERLVRHVLGERISAEKTAQVVALAAGNAFYLEELIRAVSEGNDELPDSVLAMAQVRYERIEGPGRRLLRVASVFGEVFWQGAVQFLMPELRAGEAARWLERLVDRELIERRARSRFRDEVEYQFRHALLRQAAYAGLTEADRMVAHGLAAQWLEQVGEADPMTMAEHLDRAGETAKAVTWYRRAAEHALDGGDFVAAQKRAIRAIDCGASGEDLVALKLVGIEALKWEGRNETMAREAREVAGLVSVGDPAWCRAIADMATGGGLLADAEDMLTTLEVTAANASSFLIAASRVLTRSYIELRAARVLPLTEKVEKVAREYPHDGVVGGWICQSRAFGTIVDTWDMARAIALLRQARALFAENGDARNSYAQLVDEGFALLETGLYNEAEQLISGALPEMQELRLNRLVPHAEIVLATARVRSGRWAEAVPLLELLRMRFASEARPHFNNARALQMLALAHFCAGDLERAELVAREAVEFHSRTATNMFDARPVLARVLLARSRPAEALALLDVPEPIGCLSYVEGGPISRWLGRVDGLRAVGREREADDAARTARESVLSLAGRISDARIRASFLENVPDVRRILMLSSGR